MSKEIDKFNKTFKPLKKTADDTLTGYRNHLKNREHHKQMLLQSAIEIGRVAQGLKDEGATGSELKDFAKAPEMVSVLGTAQDALAALGKEDGVLKKLLSDATDTRAALVKLHGEIEGEIADRKKKRDRKILAVDSKSLPEMEKLAPEVLEAATSLKDEVIEMQKTENWSLDMEKKNFDKWVKTEIGKTKESRDKSDEKDLDERGLDIRLVQRAIGLLKQHVEAAKGHCADAVKHLQNNAAEEANTSLEAAGESLKAIRTLHAPYRRQLDRLRPFDLKAMEQSKDGKFILQSVEAMEKAISGVDTLIKKASRLSN